MFTAVYVLSLYVILSMCNTYVYTFWSGFVLATGSYTYGITQLCVTIRVAKVIVLRGDLYVYHILDTVFASHDHEHEDNFV